MRAHTDYLWFNTRARRELVNITDQIAGRQALARCQLRDAAEHALGLILGRGRVLVEHDAALA